MWTCPHTFGVGQYECAGHGLSSYVYKAAANDGEAELTTHPDESALRSIPHAEDERRKLNM